MDSQQTATGCLWHREFDDVDEQAAFVAGYSQRYEQLASGRFHGDFMQLNLDGVDILRERVDRLLIQAGHAPEFTIGWVTGATGKYRCDGVDITPEHLIMYQADDEFEILTGASEMYVVSVAPALFDDWIDGHSDETSATALRGVRKVAPPRLSALQHQVNNAICQAKSEAGICDSLQRDAIHDDLLNAISAVVKQPDVVERRNRRREKTFERVVAAARQLIAQDMSGSLTVDDIGLQVGVSRRTLYNAFNEKLELSPGHYLQSVRMNAARRAIKRNAHAGRTIAEIAEDLGFAHQSHFAAAYKLRFGELPSQTGRRARRSHENLISKAPTSAKSAIHGGDI